MQLVCDSPYLTPKEASDYCRVNRSTLWRAVKSGRIKQYGPGTAVRYRRDELDRLDGCPQPQVVKPPTSRRRARN